jgi:hypothetical protein
MPVLHPPAQVPLAPNVVAATTYYGDRAPPYYTTSDAADLDQVTARWGGGVPRYAMIVAKYARHLLERSGAQQVDFVSASFGSLVVRWLIEKDVEGLASQKKIARWLSAEGLLAGNWAASRDETEPLLDLLGIASVDLDHMSYGWIAANLHSPRTQADDPHYADILMGSLASTNDTDNNAALSLAMTGYGEFAPNDGVQALPDARFQTITDRSRLLGQAPTLCLYHVDHYGLGDDRGARAEAASFITQRRRVIVTMTSAQVTDLHEIHLPLWDWRPAEIVFESRAYSPAASARWGIRDPLSTCDRAGAAAPVRRYQKDGETQSFQQTVFDGLVPDDEQQLRLDLDAHEIDNDWRYGVIESAGDAADDLGAGSIMVSATAPGTYTFHGRDWSCTLAVDVVVYPFSELLGVRTEPVGRAPTSLQLSPNPFSSTLRVSASPSPVGELATLSIFDLTGRRVGRMSGDSRAAFEWRGLDAEGHPLPAGVYLYRWETADVVLFGRSLLVR